MTPTAIGRKKWAIPGGHIPFPSTGHEPQFTSHDKVCLLNASYEEAHVEITVFYESRDPVGPYRLAVPARRVRHVRFNDLIDPEALPLDTAYATVIEADVPVVAQFTRLDSRQAENALLGAMAFPAGP